MKTATHFEIYKRASLAQLWAEDNYWKSVTHHGFKSAKSIELLRITKKRARQRDKLAARITADLAADGWTYITDDPATLPADSAAGGWTWYSAAWVDTDGSRKVEKSSFQDGEWYNWSGPSSSLRGPAWRVYAWKPWPTPPPIEASE